MAAMKPRRPTKAAPPPKPPMRLAMLQSATPRRHRKSGRAVLSGLLLVIGASLAGAAWMGGSLVDARDAMAGAADGVLADAGFAVAEVAIEGVSGARAAEVEAAALPQPRGSLFGAEPATIKQRVEALDWVQEARVARLWPGTVKIQVERRQAAARWRVNGREITVDMFGKPAPAIPGKDATLPLLIGADAGYSAAAILTALEARPMLAKRVDSLTFVGKRRWTVHLKDGPALLLPASDAGAALDRFAAAEATLGLDRMALAAIDLRLPQDIVLAPKTELAGAPGLSGA